MTDPPPSSGPRVLHLRDFAFNEEEIPGGHRASSFRGAYWLPADVERIDRGTHWGNPYKIGRDGDREQVLKLYAARAYGSYAGDPTYFEPLIGKRLACHCRPREGFNGRLLCHGQIIIGLLDGVAPETVE